MNHYQIYNYVYEVFSNCFKRIFINKIIINNYNYKKEENNDFSYKKNPYIDDLYGNCSEFEFEFENIPINLEINKEMVINRYFCYECKCRISGEIFMFDDKPFCRNFCRNKSIKRKLY